jgi:hypothetical protein
MAEAGVLKVRNPIAKSLRNPVFKKRVVKDRTKYKRNARNRNKEYAGIERC